MVELDEMRSILKSISYTDCKMGTSLSPVWREMSSWLLFYLFQLIYLKQMNHHKPSILLSSEMSNLHKFWMHQLSSFDSLFASICMKYIFVNTPSTMAFHWNFKIWIQYMGFSYQWWMWILHLCFLPYFIRVCIHLFLCKAEGKVVPMLN